VAQPRFLDQWANFSCVEKKTMGKMGNVFIDSSLWSILLYLYVASVFPIKPNSCSPKLTVKIQEAILFFFFS